MSFIEITLKVLKKVLCFPLLLVTAISIYIFYLPINFVENIKGSRVMQISVQKKYVRCGVKQRDN
jgi:uncharacterized membrane protein